MKIKYKKLPLIITIITVLSLTGCEDKSKLGILDKNDEIYKNNYFDFTVTHKLNYTFVDNENITTNMGDLEVTELFKLVDENTDDVVKGYYTDIKDSIDKTAKEFVSAKENKEGVVNHSNIFKNGKYLSVDFTNNSTSYRVSFRERKDSCLIFIMTYKSDRDKNIRTKYTDYMYFE